MIKALVIDDEESGCIVLEQLIQNEHQHIDLLESVNNVRDAINVIDNMHPNLVFLDIRLGNDSGFEILNKTIFRNYHVIIVTAYSEYALQAIKASALDYLLKPVSRVELSEAIDRFRERNHDISEISRLANILERSTVLNDKKIALPSSSGYEFISLADIQYLSADRNYTNFYFKNGRVALATRTLGLFEAQLRNQGFLRIHKSHIVNLNEISFYIPGNGGSVRMSNGKRLEVSRRKKKELLGLINIGQPAETAG